MYFSTIREKLEGDDGGCCMLLSQQLSIYDERECGFN